MRYTMRVPKLCLVVSLLTVWACAGTARLENQDVRCGPGLSHAEIIEIAKKAVDDIGGSSEELLRDHEVTIGQTECDYTFTAVARGAQAVEPVSMRISRAGKVMNFPWCCSFGTCLGLCSPEEPVVD